MSRLPRFGDVVEMEGMGTWTPVVVDQTFLAFRVVETLPHRWRWPHSDDWARTSGYRRSRRRRGYRAFPPRGVPRLVAIRVTGGGG